MKTPARASREGPGRSPQASTSPRFEQTAQAKSPLSVETQLPVVMVK